MRTHQVGPRIATRPLQTSNHVSSNTTSALLSLRQIDLEHSTRPLYTFDRSALQHACWLPLYKRREQ
ncbi:unnamed protein product [Zymoseptoria tritici ST99CH_3D1]|nr:unnamed protein product [Zymoseptoria tritici ST99CH_3D1]